MTHLTWTPPVEGCVRASYALRWQKEPKFERGTPRDGAWQTRRQGHVMRILTTISAVAAGLVAAGGVASNGAVGFDGAVTETDQSASATPVCHGEPATIVGTGARLEGTPDDDVVVTNGALEIYTYGGADTICVTLPPPGGYVDSPSVSAGSGRDLIDTSALPTGNNAVFPFIRPGGEADVVLGGPTDERVETCEQYTTGVVSTDAPDTIVLAEGDDWVTLCPRTSPDAVDLGEGDDIALLRGPRGPHGDLVAGPGDNSLYFLDDLNASDRWIMDLARKTSTLNGTPTFTWDNASRFFFDVSPGFLRIAGSDEREEISIDSVNEEGPTWTLDLDLAGGNDRISLDVEALGPNSRVDAGSGRDSIHVSAILWRLAINLNRSTLIKGRDAARFQVDDVENASAYARHLRIVGTDDPNYIDAAGCDAVVRARRGADTVTLSGFQGRRFRCPDAAHHAYGGAGQDELRGRRHRDTLIGGRGRDWADGRQGWDVCDTEQRVHCEAR
ncbi:hypothetical protein [Nocardioides sp. P5_E3]